MDGAERIAKLMDFPVFYCELTTARKVQIDGKSLESAENRLKNVLADFERQGYLSLIHIYFGSFTLLFLFICRYFISLQQIK